MAVQARVEIASESADERAGAVEKGENTEEGEAEATQPAQGEIQEYLDNSSAEDTGDENRVPLLNAVT